MNLVPEAKASTAGIDRRVRITGTSTHDHIVLSVACERNQDIVQESQGLVSFLHQIFFYYFHLHQDRIQRPQLATRVDLQPS